MDEFLKDAQRIPVRFFMEKDSPYSQVEDTSEPAASGGQGQPRESKSHHALFDADAAVVFNEMLPLLSWLQAMESPVLPAHLRLILSRAAWVRAVLLDKDENAMAVAASLKDRDPAANSYLSSYLNAKTRETRKFAAICAFLKYPGLRPYLPGGLGRTTPLEQIDDYRDNWWCALKCLRATGENCAHDFPNYFVDATAMNTSQRTLYPGNKMTWPAFISPADRETAGNERKTLASLGPAPNYLSNYVVSYAKGKSPDPNLAEALHLAVRSTRYGCTDKETAKYSKSAYEVLHKKYPQSPWAKKTPYWFQ
jgi:hypothetical protein